MAHFIAAASGNLTNSIWATTDASSAQTNTTGNFTLTSVGTSYSPNFTIANGAVIDGVLLNLSGVSLTPASGTLNVTLNNGTTDVATGTLNIAYTASFAGWYFVKFASTYTSTGLATMRLGVQCNTTSVVMMRRSTTTNDWARIFRTTTVGAPGIASGDILYISGEHSGGAFTQITVDVNEGPSAPNTYREINVSHGGLLNWPINADSTLKMAGNLNIWAFGEARMGSVSSPILSSFTAELFFVNSTNVDFGVNVNSMGTFKGHGALKTPYGFTQVTVAASATTSTLTSTPTGWKSGDTLLFPTTSRTASQSETVTLSANVTGTGLTHSALANQHEVLTADWGHVYRCEVGNLTRNVKIHGTSTTLQSFINASTFTNLDLRYVECYFMGSGTSFKRGINFNPSTTTFNSTTYGACSLVGCALHDFEISNSIGFYLDGGSAPYPTVLIDNNVFYKMRQIAIVIDTQTSRSTSIATISNNLIASQGVGSGVNLNHPTDTWTNNYIVGCSSGVNLSSSVGEATASVTMSNFWIRAASTAGVNNSGTAFLRGTLTNFHVYRCNANGLIFNTVGALKFVNSFFFGNNTANLSFSNGVRVVGMEFRNCRFDNGCNATDTTLVATNCIVTGPEVVVSGFKLIGCTFVKTAPSGSAFYFGAFNQPFSLDVGVINSTYTLSNFLSTSTSLLNNDGRIWFQNTTAFGLANWVQTNTAQIDLDTTRQVTGYSIRGVPQAGSTKIKIPVATFAVESGKQAQIFVDVRKSVAGDGATYGGSQPRLMVKENQSIGITADTVLATASNAANGAFQTLSGTIPTPTANGVIEVYVDADTNGFVNVDNPKCLKIDSPSGTMSYYLNGKPFPFASKQNTNTKTKKYWYNGLPVDAVFSPYVSDPFGIGNVMFRLDDDGRERIPNGMHREIVASKRRDTTVVSREVAARDGIV